MASTYSDLKIELIGTGEQAGTWGATTNTNLGTALEEAIVGRATANFTADADLTLTLTNVNTTQVARHYILNVTSGVSLTLTRNLIVPTIDKPYIIENNTTGGQSIVVKTTAGTGVTIPNGKRAMVYANSTNVVAATNFIPDLTINSGNIDNTTIGATTPNTGRFTTLNALGNVTLGDSTSLDSHTINGATAVSVNTTTDAFKITQTGTGNAFVVEDSASADATPFVIDSVGNVGIGAFPSAGRGLSISTNLTGSASPIAVLCNSTVQSDATNVSRGFSTAISTAAAISTTSITDFQANVGTKGAGSSVSDQYGFGIVTGWGFGSTLNCSFYVSGGVSTAAANTYGYYSAIPSGTGRYNLYMDGTANNYMAGSLGIGQLSILATKLAIAGTHTGSITSNGIQVFGTVASDVTNAYYGVTSAVSTAAATFTLGSLNHYGASQGTIGAGSTVTNQSGFNALNTLIGATNNYGFAGTIAAGTGRFNLYMAGTADNYLAGNLGIGAVTTGFENVMIQKNITGGTTAFGIRNIPTVKSDVTSVALACLSSAGTDAAVFTCSFLEHFTSSQGVFGAGSTVTSQAGFSARASHIGATNNYGFYGNIPSGTGRYNIYMAGTANNAFAGNSRFGGVTAPTVAVDVTGDIKATGNISGGYVAHTSGTTAMAFGTSNVVRVTPNATATYTTTVPAAGAIVVLSILTSGTTSYTITLGTGFKSTGTLATGTTTARYFNLTFVSDGTNLIETDRTVAIA